jgi:hypothetical protein
MTATNKWYSYSRVMMIQIDVQPVGETLSTHHMHYTLGPRMTIDQTCDVPPLSKDG